MLRGRRKCKQSVAKQGNQPVYAASPQYRFELGAVRNDHADPLDIDVDYHVLAVHPAHTPVGVEPAACCIFDPGMHDHVARTGARCLDHPKLFTRIAAQSDRVGLEDPLAEELPVGSFLVGRHLAPVPASNESPYFVHCKIVTENFPEPVLPLPDRAVWRRQDLDGPVPQGLNEMTRFRLLGLRFCQRDLA